MTLPDCILSLADELALGVHGAAHDVVDHVLRQLVLEHAVDEAGELRVQALVARNQLVGEGETRHETPLLEPVDGAEGPITIIITITVTITISNFDYKIKNNENELAIMYIMIMYNTV